MATPPTKIGNRNLAWSDTLVFLSDETVSIFPFAADPAEALQFKIVIDDSLVEPQILFLEENKSLLISYHRSFRPGAETASFNGSIVSDNGLEAFEFRFTTTIIGRRDQFAVVLSYNLLEDVPHG